MNRPKQYLLNKGFSLSGISFALLMGKEINIMNTSKDKIKGQTNLAAGKVKVAMGELSNSDKMKIKGQSQKLKGEAQIASSNIKDTIDKGIKKIEQVVKNK